MNRERLSLGVHAASAAALLLLLAVPPVLDPSTGLEPYYSATWPEPLALGLLASGTVAGALLQTGGFVERETLAGLVVVVAGALLLVATGWALLGQGQAAVGLPTMREFVYHRWVVLAFAAVTFGTALWYADIVRRTMRESASSE
ncbi:DUF7548 family protein [Haloarchaeobius baliensis]|uniref:DUF7548 family protein n=1 Tax=Haloarchaeobius baliensis TaxID=1670458 RepID=UPI003F885A0C